MDIEAFDSKIQSIKDELNSLSNNILSANERINKIKEIQEKTRQTKEELENEMNNLTDEEKEKAEACLNTLNELISFELALYTTATATTTQPEQAPWNWNNKEWFFTKAKNRIWSQWSDIWNTDKWKNESGKNLLRSVGFAVTWVGIVSLAYGWIKRLRRKLRETRPLQTADTPEAQPEQENTPWFRQRPFGKFLKRLWIGSAVAWWTYALWKRFNWWDRLKQRWGNRAEDNTEYTDDIDSNYGEAELRELRWFETECKSLKEQANNRRKLATKENGVNYVDNAKEYRRILNKALYLQDKSVEIYEKIFGSNESSYRTKNETENLKNQIDRYVRKIYAMKDEVFQNVPEWTDLWDENEFEWNYTTSRYNNGWNNGWNWTSDNPESWWEETPESFEPISANHFSNAAITYLKTNVPDLPFSNDTQNKVQWTLNTYFNSYPIIKKSNKRNMIFEIWNKAAFSAMLKQLREQIMSWMSRIERKGARVFYWKKIDAIETTINNIDGTLNNLDPNQYENVIFNCLWWIVKNVVEVENWTMTVQNYYNNVKRYYPNINETQIDNDLRNSWQAEKDIKYMSTNRIKPAQA